MVNVLKLLVVFSLSYVFSGCAIDRLNKFYDYKRVEKYIVEHDLTIDAQMKGTFVVLDSKKKKLTERGNPYDLIIGIQGRTLSAETINLNEVQLLSSSNGKIRRLPEYERTAHKRLKETGQKEYIWLISGIEVLYENIDVVLSFSFNSDNGESVTFDVKMNLQTDYKEEKSNDLIDRVLSV